MKRLFLLLAVSAVLFLAGGQVFAAEYVFKIKGGLDYGPSLSGDMATQSDIKYLNTTFYSFSDSSEISGNTGGITIGIEWLSILSDTVKLGGEWEYLLPRKTNILVDNEYYYANGNRINPTISYLPIYVVIEVNPLYSYPEIFIKAGIGYSLFFFNPHSNVFDNAVKEISGGLCFKLGAGYDFEGGLFLELSYTRINSSLKYTGSNDYIYRYEYTNYAVKENWTNGFNNIVYQKIGLAVGYKFNFDL